MAGLGTAQRLTPARCGAKAVRPWVQGRTLRNTPRMARARRIHRRRTGGVADFLLRQGKKPRGGVGSRNREASNCRSAGGVRPVTGRYKSGAARDGHQRRVRSGHGSDAGETLHRPGAGIRAVRPAVFRQPGVSDRFGLGATLLGLEVSVRVLRGIPSGQRRRVLREAAGDVQSGIRFVVGAALRWHRHRVVDVGWGSAGVGRTLRLPAPPPSGRQRRLRDLDRRPRLRQPPTTTTSAAPEGRRT